METTGRSFVSSPAGRRDTPRCEPAISWSWPAVGTEAGDQVRLLVEVVDAVADLFAVDGGPPRALVVGPGPGDGGLDVGHDGADLTRLEHAPQVDVAGALEEVADLVVGVVEG